MNYTWPGNIRELENALERAIVLNNNNYLEFNDLPTNNQSKGKEDIQNKKAIVEKEVIENYLRAYQGNISKTADALGITRQTLYRKMKYYSINRQMCYN